MGLACNASGPFAATTVDAFFSKHAAAGELKPRVLSSAPWLLQLDDFVSRTAVDAMLQQVGRFRTAVVNTAHGYRSTLLFWMILPLVLVLIVLLASLGVTLVRRKCTLAAFVEVSLPNVLRVLFVVYPLVTNKAFEAFPLHQFSDAAFLKVCTGTQTAFRSCIQRLILRVRRSI